MKTTKYLRYVWLTIFALLVVSGGCNWFGGPQQKPAPGPTPQQQQKAMQSEPEITVYMHETGEKKKMKLEEYLAGVVAGEMKTEWPVNALAAQAIIARTFTMHEIETKGGVPERGAQASTDIKEFQAYNAQAINANIKKAVEMTRGMILTYQGKPINAWFHASAGGITATAKEGLDYQEAEPPYIRSVQSPDDLAPADVKNWTASFTKQEVMAAMSKIGKPVSSLDNLTIGEKGPSGRVMTFKVNGRETVSGPNLRVALDSMKLKSMLLDKVEVSGDKVIFTGKGYGHGVGMSQWGANKMAADGKKPEEIARYYFKDVEIEKRWQ